MRNVAAAGFVCVALVFFVPSAQAQTCAGGPAITKARPTQAGALVAFAEDIFVAGASLAGGTDSLVGVVSLARGSFDIGGGADLSSTAISLSAGMQLPVKADKSSMFCPVVVINRVLGPNDILGTGVDASEWGVGGGGSFGVLLGDAAGIQLIPTAGLQVLRVSQTLKGGSISVSESDTHGTVVLGLGLLVNDRVSVLPTIRIPFGVEDGKNLYGVQVLFSFGK